MFASAHRCRLRPIPQHSRSLSLFLSFPGHVRVYCIFLWHILRRSLNLYTLQLTHVEFIISFFLYMRYTLELYDI